MAETKKILIIDDDETFTRTLSDILSGEGYTVVTAPDGEEGLKMLDKEKPDLILLDILMPKMSGIALLKKLKERDGSVTTPVLISSNLDSMEEISGAISLGAVGYVVKSDQDLESIKQTIERTLKDAE